MYITCYDNDEMWTDLVYKDIKPMYKISTYGRVKNKYTEKFISISTSEKGYSMVSLMVISNRQKTFKLHRIVASIFIPKQQNDDGTLTVNHKNGNKTDNSIYNLEWVSFSENIRHAYINRLNTPRIGTLNGHSKYSEDVIECICKLISENYNGRYIRKYIRDTYSIDITRYLIFDIKHKKSWTHISNKYSI